jgi:hypothetical protein
MTAVIELVLASKFSVDFFAVFDIETTTNKAVQFAFVFTMKRVAARAFTTTGAARIDTCSDVVHSLIFLICLCAFILPKTLKSVNTSFGISSSFSG